MKDETQIVLGVTGSIAAYKAAELVRRMRKEGWSVSVVMTRAAREFVSELTFRTLSQRPVACELFADAEAWRPEHIALAEAADALVIAPCTANVIGKLTHGIADDLLSCVAMATRAPIVLAPAMNVAMWDSPATRENVAALRNRGVCVVDVGEGDLACGYEGRGRMAEPAEILVTVRNVLASGR